jgi:hypothetical protein
MSKYAKGYKAYFICDRSGRKYPYNQAVKEPGTGWKVHWTESDGMWNIVDHPQNFTPHDVSDTIGLRNPRPDINEETSISEASWLGAIGVSATNFGSRG